jgi:1-acyl-sn-glycerol-3-phosphate acyltransferase
LASASSTTEWSCTASHSTANARPPSSLWRAGLRIAALGGWLLLCLPPHLLSKALGKSRWPVRFLGGVARICGADVRTLGSLESKHALLVANHRSWLDIPVLSGATGCRFISKAELGSHPVMKWLVDQNRTLYVNRSDVRALPQQAEELRKALSSDQPVALFAEATVATGAKLLPFKPSLFSAVIPPPPGCAINPVAVDYGAAALELAWGPDEQGVRNALRILGRKGRIPVTVTILPALDPALDRKRMARAAHDAVAAALAPSGIAPADLYAGAR